LIVVVSISSRHSHHTARCVVSPLLHDQCISSGKLTWPRCTTPTQKDSIPNWCSALSRHPRGFFGHYWRVVCLREAAAFRGLPLMSRTLILVLLLSPARALLIQDKTMPFVHCIDVKGRFLRSNQKPETKPFQNGRQTKAGRLRNISKNEGRRNMAMSDRKPYLLGYYYSCLTTKSKRELMFAGGFLVADTRLLCMS
jgi:hypothetical protein